MLAGISASYIPLFSLVMCLSPKIGLGTTYCCLGSSVHFRRCWKYWNQCVQGVFVCRGEWSEWCLFLVSRILKCVQVGMGFPEHNGIWVLKSLWSAIHMAMDQHKRKCTLFRLLTYLQLFKNVFHVFTRQLLACLKAMISTSLNTRSWEVFLIVNIFTGEKIDSSVQMIRLEKWSLQRYTVKESTVALIY